jgi:hypothetical protein
MTETIISKPALLVDLPEVKNLKSNFVYNYFVEDERVNETPDANGNQSFISTTVNLSSTEQATYTVNSTSVIDADLRAFYGRNSRFPRYVKLTFEIPSIERIIKINRENLDLIFQNGEIPRESALNVFGRTGVSIVDTTLDKTIYRLLTGSLDYNPSQQVTEDATDRLISGIRDSIQPNGYRFASTDARAQASSNVEDAIQQIEFGFSYDTRTAADIANGSLNSSKSVYADEISKTVLGQGAEDLDNLQRQAIADSDPYIIRLTDYEETFKSVINIINDQQEGSATPGEKLKNYLVGFIVQKLAVQSNGTQSLITEKIITTPNATSFLDANVAYGRRYRYNVIAIYACQFEMTQQVRSGRSVFEDRKVSKFVLFASRGAATTVTCEEVVAPPPPVDLKFRYRGDNTGLNITWNFPVNLQRDIKKFQVFRRSSTSDPFQLIKVYDFDDSIVKSSDPEGVPERLITRSLLPTTIHHDTDFNKNSRFIYAICAIDAHGLTSNYSVQLEASYDRYRNKINTRVISRSDAPKPFPNIFLNKDTFVDTMKMSSYTRLNIYFNPDYMTLYNRDGVDVEHIKYYNTDRGDDNTYKMMLVNTDFQQSQVLDIKINDSYIQPPIITPSTARVFRPT